jgi:hypothetical protein
VSRALSPRLNAESFLGGTTDEFEVMAVDAAGSLRRIP